MIISKRSQSARVRPGEWEEAYFRALRAGHTKGSACALAGVSASTPGVRRQRDLDFATAEEIAYGVGTSRLERVAFRRVSDPEHPADGVLRHLLACRSRDLNARVQVEAAVEHSGEVQHYHGAQPMDRVITKLSPAARIELLKALGGAPAEESVEPEAEPPRQPTRLPRLRKRSTARAGKTAPASSPEPGFDLSPETGRRSQR